MKELSIVIKGRTSRLTRVYWGDEDISHNIYSVSIESAVGHINTTKLVFNSGVSVNFGGRELTDEEEKELDDAIAKGVVK